MSPKVLKALKKSDKVSMLFGDWFDKVNGNTYYDVEVTINGDTKLIRYQYGYNSGDKQSIDEALASCGYRVRVDKRDRFSPYRSLDVYTCNKLKRELFK